jgi:VWFA-related protein
MKKLLAVLIISLLAGSGVVSPTHAQDNGLTVVIDDINVEQYASDQSIQLHVTVRHPQGGVVPDLGPEAFTITVGDQTYVPTQAEMKHDARVSLAVVLELYQTMRGEPFEQAKAAIGNLFTGKDAQDRVAFFSVRPGVDADAEAIDAAYERDFTFDGGDVNNFVQGVLELISTGSGTPLYDTLVRAIRFTAKEPLGQRAIVVITDGGDVGSRYTSEAVIDAAEELHVPVYSIGYTGNNRIKDQFLNELARRTGGRYQDTPDSADFDQFLQDVRDDMSQHYLLTYESEPLSSGRQVLEIRVEAAGLIGTHSKHFDIEGGSATPTPAPPTATPKPTQLVEESTAPPIATTDTVTTTATITTTGELEPVAEEESLVDTLQDNPAIIVAIVGGVGLLVLLLVLVLTWRRQREEPETMWGAEAPHVPAPAPTAPEEWASHPPRATERPAAGADTPFRTQVQAPDQGDVPPPGQFAPAPPALGQQAPSPAARQAKTEIIQRGPKMAYHALLIDRQQPTHKHDVNKPVISLGRTTKSDVVLDNPRISRQHAVIKLEADTFRVYDLGSSNGTFVNDQKVVEPIALEDGDIVRFGDLDFIFKIISLG